MSVIFYGHQKLCSARTTKTGTDDDNDGGNDIGDMVIIFGNVDDDDKSKKVIYGYLPLYHRWKI